MSSDCYPAAGDLLPVRTTLLDQDPGPLLDLLPATGQLAWVHGAEGLVGWGEAARIDVTGPHRFAQAQRWWDSLCSGWQAAGSSQAAEGLPPGAGPVAFVSFDFDGRGPSTLVVPRVLVGRRNGQAWITRIGPSPHLLEPTPVHAPGPVRVAPGDLSAPQWRELVTLAVGRIRAGELSKVVLARDLVASCDTPLDDRWLLGKLAERYEQCWTFAVAGLVGATPELLLRVGEGASSSLVLAGSSSVGEQGDRLDTAKNRSEHRYAVESLVGSLTGLGAIVDPPPPPHTLRLPNVLHLATWLTSTLPEAATLLDVAAGVHPTASVGGTPTGTALELIAELEPTPRGRYLGPVGYADADGNGELGLALRCALVSGSQARLWAGCGIVADSDPHEELAETEMKFRPLLEALGADR